MFESQSSAPLSSLMNQWNLSDFLNMTYFLGRAKVEFTACTYQARLTKHAELKMLGPTLLL